MHNNINEPRKAKTAYSLKRREYKVGGQKEVHYKPMHHQYITILRVQYNTSLQRANYQNLLPSSSNSYC
jgi:hypothetical protein